MLKAKVGPKSVWMLGLVVLTLSLVSAIAITLFYFFKPRDVDFGDVLPLIDFLLVHACISAFYLAAGICVLVLAHRQRDASAALFVMSFIFLVFGLVLLTELNWEYDGSTANTWTHWVLIGIGLWTPAMSLGVLITSSIFLRNVENKKCDDLEGPCESPMSSDWKPENAVLNKRRTARLQF